MFALCLNRELFVLAKHTVSLRCDFDNARPALYGVFLAQCNASEYAAQCTRI